MQVAHDTDEDFERDIAPIQPVHGDKRLLVKTRNKSMQHKQILNQENLVKMDSKKLLDILEHLNHVTDSEEVTSAVNLIRVNIN